MGLFGAVAGIAVLLGGGGGIGAVGAVGAVVVIRRFAPAGAGAGERAAAGWFGAEGAPAGGGFGGGGGDLIDAFAAELHVHIAGVVCAEVGPLVPAGLADQAIAERDALAAGEAGGFDLAEAHGAEFGELAGRAGAPGGVAGVEAAEGDERNEDVPQAHEDPPLPRAGGG